MSAAPRRRWRERVDAGIYRAYRTGCPRSADHRPGGRCDCPFQVKAPGVEPGTVRTVTVRGTVADARSAHLRFRATGRPAPTPPPVTVGEDTLDAFAVSYFRAKAPGLAPSTVAGREDAYRLRVSPTLGGLALADLTRERVEVWLAETAATSSAHAVWKAVAALRAILKVAVEWGRLPDNPAAGLTLPRQEVGDEAAAERVLDASQLRTLLATPARPGVSAMLRAAGEAGLRSGEVIGLRWGDVDLPGRRLTVRLNVWHGQVKEPKGRRARRVAISGAFAAALGEWYAQSVIGAGRDAEGYVWPGRRGGPMGYGSPGQALARVADRAGLIDAEGRPLVSFQGLRHTAASIMLGAGVPLIVVSRQLGHANPQITATVYAHLLGDAKSRATTSGPSSPPTTLDGDALLVATGRAASARALGLEAVGIEGDRSGIPVDARLRTTAPNVWAAGDVLGPEWGQFTHVARRMGVEVAKNALGVGPHDVPRDVGPRRSSPTPRSCRSASPRRPPGRPATASRSGPLDSAGASLGRGARSADWPRWSPRSARAGSWAPTCSPATAPT